MRVFAVGDWKYRKKIEKIADTCAESRMRRNETRYPFWMNFGVLVAIPDIVNSIRKFWRRSVQGSLDGGVKFPRSP